MSITGVYFIPSYPNASTAFGTVIERLHTSFADEPIPVGRWTLEHKLMRDTPSCLPTSALQQQQPQQPRYMQFLFTSSYPGLGFIYTSEASETSSSSSNPSQPNPPAAAADQGSAQDQTSQSMVMTAIPFQSYNTLFHHFAYACQPLWCHRHTVTVPSGAVYDVGDFRVRVGDVRQVYPTVRVRGTVVQVEWRSSSLVSHVWAQPANRGYYKSAGVDSSDSGVAIKTMIGDITDSDVDADYAATAELIREFWAQFGIDGAREALFVPGLGKETRQRLRIWKRQEDKAGQGQQYEAGENTEAGADEARQLMEIFRFSR